MRGVVPGDPASLSALGSAAKGAARELTAAHGRSATAYASLKASWGTSTSVRTRKEGTRVLATLAEGVRHADAVGSAIQSYAVELSQLQARTRAAVEEATRAGLVIEDGEARMAWGVTGEADPGAMRMRVDALRRVQTELDAVTAQHRRRRDRLLAEITESTTDLEGLANALRLG